MNMKMYEMNKYIMIILMYRDEQKKKKIPKKRKTQKIRKWQMQDLIHI